MFNITESQVTHGQTPPPQARSPTALGFKRESIGAPRPVGERPGAAGAHGCGGIAVSDRGAESPQQRTNGATWPYHMIVFKFQELSSQRFSSLADDLDVWLIGKESVAIFTGYLVNDPKRF